MDILAQSSSSSSSSSSLSLSSLIQHSRSLPADHPLPPLLGLPDVDVAADPPVAEPEGVGHGVSDVGPADDGDGDTHDGVEYRHDLPHRGLGGNVPVSCRKIELNVEFYHSN